MSGAVVSALLLLTVFDDNLLFHIYAGGKNMLWYIAVFSAVLALSRSTVPDLEVDTSDAAHADPEETVVQVRFVGQWKHAIV